MSMENHIFHSKIKFISYDISSIWKARLHYAKGVSMLWTVEKGDHFNLNWGG